MHIIFKNANNIAKMENFFFSSSPIYVLNDVINSDKSFFVPKMWGKEDMCQKSIYFDKWKCLCGSKITYSMYTFKIVWSDWRTKLNFGTLSNFLFCWGKELFVGINDIFKYMNRSAWKNKVLNLCNFINIFSMQTQLNSFCKKKYKVMFLINREGSILLTYGKTKMQNCTLKV